VAVNGLVSVAGQRPDGTPINQTSPITINGYMPLNVPLDAGQGALLGWVHFTNSPGRGLTGTAAWIKAGAGGLNPPRLHQHPDHSGFPAAVYAGAGVYTPWCRPRRRRMV
jgi:hypothetical protein